MTHSMSRLIIVSLLGLIGLVTIATSLWGFANSTMTYGMIPLDAATSAHLSRIYARLAAAGAPETALRRLAVATQPDINIGTASEALADVDRILVLSDTMPAIAAVHTEIRVILAELDSRRYGYVNTMTVMLGITPWGTLNLP